MTWTCAYGSACVSVPNAYTYISKLFILMLGHHLQPGQSSCCSRPPEGTTPPSNSAPYSTVLQFLMMVGKSGSFLAEDSKALPVSSLGLEGGHRRVAWLAVWGKCRSSSLAGPSAICTTAPLSALSPLCLRVHHSGDPWELELIFHHH